MATPFIATFFLNRKVKEFLKLANICQRYERIISLMFFDSQCILYSRGWGVVGGVVVVVVVVVEVLVVGSGVKPDNTSNCY